MTPAPFDTEHLRDDIKRRSARGGLATLGAQAVKFALNLGGIAVLSRLLAPDDFGLVAMATSITGVAYLLKDMGLSAATIQRSAITNSEVNTIFWVNTAVGFAAAVLLMLAAPMVGWFYGRHALVAIMVASAAGFLVSGVGVQHQALLSRQMEFGRLAMVDVCSVLAGNLLGIGRAFAGCGYWSIIATQAGMVVTTAAGLWLVSHWRPGRPAFDRAVLPMLAFGAQLTGVNVLNYVSRNADNVLIGRFCGAEQLGLYYRAYQLLMLPLLQINAPVYAVAVPALSRLLDTPEKYRAAYLQFAEKVLLLAVPAMAWLLSAADLVVEVALGSQWRASVPIFSWLAMLGFLLPLMQSAGWLFITQGRTREFLWQTALDCVLCIGSFVAGLPWGAIGVAMAYAISGVLIRAPLAFWMAGRRGPVATREFYKLLCRFALLAAVVWGAVSLVKPLLPFPSPLARLAALFLVAACAVAGFLTTIPSGRRVIRELSGVLRTFIR